jgi:hypothetical protein
VGEGIAIDRIIDVFFSQLSNDETEEAIDNLFARSQHKIRPAELQSLAVQLRNLITVNGHVSERELIVDAKIGSMCVRRSYLVQMERTVTRWEFALVRLPGGWATVHFGFDDRAEDWL